MKKQGETLWNEEKRIGTKKNGKECCQTARNQTNIFKVAYQMFLYIYIQSRTYTKMYAKSNAITVFIIVSKNLNSQITLYFRAIFFVLPRSKITKLSFAFIYPDLASLTLCSIFFPCPTILSFEAISKWMELELYTQIYKDSFTTGQKNSQKILLILIFISTHSKLDYWNQGKVSRTQYSLWQR